ncbi:hypothetical protein [Microbulbifer sp. 2205BS26-8]|uniref:hypothetical protein n=1 Tax=Microbulbifer sp. 2205BS26-8 TaxID=3064386 RepID=UPI002740281A|nr:hypothetical protein [Microbulbifer sp. 2205BS26-8]MDP5208852.1 hypothetical protein [Microbulbifer sp. 2205BS26-8]
MEKILIILLSLYSLAGLAYDKPVRVDMEGIVKIWGNQSSDSEMSGLSIFITGEAAKRLYKEMKAEAVHNECFDDGTLTKQLGSFECSYSKKYKYSCSVGIGLSDQKLFNGEAC